MTATNADEQIPSTSTHRTISVEARVLGGVAIFLAAVIAAVSIWGLPALAMIALAAVPVMFVVMLLITVGK